MKFITLVILYPLALVSSLASTTLFFATTIAAFTDPGVFGKLVPIALFVITVGLWILVYQLISWLDDLPPYTFLGWSLKRDMKEKL